MSVLVDTCVWSVALRRRAARARGADAASDTIVRELTALVEEGRVAMLGVVRQELLSGIRDAQHFDRLRERLRAFPDLTLETADYEDAAAFHGRCRARGVQGSAIDFLICAVAARRELPIFTTDADFERYARHLPIALHRNTR